LTLGPLGGIRAQRVIQRSGWRYQKEIRALTNSDDRQIAVGAERQSVCCSFCKKEPATVGVLIEGPALPGGTPAFICQECVELCSSIFQHRKSFGGAEEHAASQSNPFFGAEKAQARQGAVERSFEDTCDAAADILRRLMEQRRNLMAEKIDHSPSTLTSLEDDILRLRRGLTDGRTYSLEQVGEKMGLAPERVAAIEARAETKLRVTEPQA
jgi:DNA-binding CsgD family transcriptional regulator